MTRINSAISVCCLTDEHLLAEHREIKRLPFCFVKAKNSGSLNKIPEKFCLGKGHVLFFLDKPVFTLWRYKEIYKECISRGFKVENYSLNWKVYFSYDLLWTNYHITSQNEKELLLQRITERIQSSSKVYFHYKGKRITKEKAIEILNLK